MEDRINAKNKSLLEKQNKLISDMENRINLYNETLDKKQNEILGQALIDMTKLIYFRPLASSHDYYKASLKSSEAVKNN